MQSQIEKLISEINLFEITNKENLESFRLQFISKKGSINDLFDGFKAVPNEEKKSVGAALNNLKNIANDKLKAHTELLENSTESESISYDYSLPVNIILGARHPLSIVKNEIIDIFQRIGFSLSEGPEIEDDWHNFTSLNFPPNHPARDMQDTFFIQTNPDIALRTHTSSVQARVMGREKPPIRTLSPGRVYRNEAISARAHCFFHQIEGMYIDKNVSFADLKNTLYYFVTEFFGKNTKIRFRPSFFPFTEPSAEIDISCQICHGSGCNVCKHSGWVEIGGSGLMHPNVLKNSNINPDEYSGFAFGMGIERMTMLKYQIKDLRIFSENDIRFLKQFSAQS